MASSLSTQAGRFASAATAYGTVLANSPNPVMQAGALTQFGMASGATIIGFMAGATEQMLRPNVGQTMVEGSIAVVVDRLSGMVPIFSPVFNEIGEALKATPQSTNLQKGINGK